MIVIDRRSFVCNDKAFILTGQSLEYLTLFLNSALFRFAFKDYFPELLGDTHEVRKVFFENVPIKRPNDESWFKKKLSEILNEKVNGREIATLQAEVDKAVFDLYSLTAPERALILGEPIVSEPKIVATSLLESS